MPSELASLTRKGIGTDSVQGKTLPALLNSFGVSTGRWPGGGFKNLSEGALWDLYEKAEAEYFKRIKASHPDVGGSDQLAASLNEAWERMTNLFRRLGIGGDKILPETLTERCHRNATFRRLKADKPQRTDERLSKLHFRGMFLSVLKDHAGQTLSGGREIVTLMDAKFPGNDLITRWNNDKLSCRMTRCYKLVVAQGLAVRVGSKGALLVTKKEEVSLV